MTGNPALEAVQLAYDTIHAIVRLGIPLLVGLVAVVKASDYAITVVRSTVDAGGGGEDDGFEEGPMWYEVEGRSDEEYEQDASFADWIMRESRGEN